MDVNVMSCSLHMLEYVKPLFLGGRRGRERINMCIYCLICLAKTFIPGRPEVERINMCILSSC